MRQIDLSMITLLILVLSAAATPSSAAGKIQEVLNDIAAQCTKTHGYDWRKPGELGDYELGRGEKAWRSCVYDGIRHQIIPASKIPKQYERAIERDIQFTQAIEAGEMTRFERWQENRMTRNLTLANEELADNSEADRQARQQEHLEEFVNRQMEDLLRVRPPIPRIY